MKLEAERAMSEQVSAPVIRALLLTDLCDSVSLVERIGDVASAGLFRSHDLLVLELQQRWSGRLIDRSDGMLLVFERPLHAIGFALDYMAGLDRLGHARQLTLKARAGLHVGEVLLWENSQQAIDVGAKPLEVEGLAKPMAARLMTMARPGQVLVSSVAEALARRASKDELGNLRDRLLWKSHGRWQFKGVPNPLEVFEVGEAGKAPMRRPRSGGKARRISPWWRRPLAIAMQAVFVAGVGLGGWYLTRSEPAVAFAPRDWVVLAGMQSDHADAATNQGIEQGLRIALEQSSHLNLLGREQVIESMVLAGHAGTDSPQRELAVEIAQREGAQAVVAPRLERWEAGWQLVLELIEPGTGRVVRRAVGRTANPDSAGLMLAVDEAVRQLRGHLGEALASIEATEPLPRVSTDSLPALRAFALAEKATGEQDYSTAAQLFSVAIEADAEFALAHMGLAKLQERQRDVAGARRHMQRALAQRDHLPLRERLYLDAWNDELSERRWALEHWEALARLFPDFAAGPSNASWYLLMDNRFSQAIPYARSVGYGRHPMRNYTLLHLARAQLGLGQYEQALATLDDVEKLTGRDSETRAEVLAAQGRLDEADAVLAPLLGGSDIFFRPWALRSTVVLAATRGDCAAMARQSRLMHASMQEHMPSMGLLAELYALQAAACASDGQVSSKRLQDVKVQIEEALGKHLSGENGLGSSHDLDQRLLALAYIAQRSGQPAFARPILARHQERISQIGNPMLIKMLTLVQAREMLDLGQPERALEHLAAQLDGTELYQAHVVMRDAYQALGQEDHVVAQQEWLRNQAGRAWAETIGNNQLQPLNALDLRVVRTMAAASPKRLAASH